MEGKLINRKNGDYNLKISNSTFATTNQVLRKQNNIKELSLKNCESIANGYDLIKLVEENSKYSEEDWGDGFLFAMKLMSDKKFSEFLDKEKELGISDIKTIERIQWYYNTYFDKSQQTEWDVKIEMEKCGYCEGCNKAGMLHCAHADSCGFPIETERPKLDTNGCLILKRK